MSDASANISSTVPALATQLDGAYNNYTAVRPCMVDLNYRIQYINNTVVVLPTNVSVRFTQPVCAPPALHGWAVHAIWTGHAEACNHVLFLRELHQSHAGLVDFWLPICLNVK